MKIGSTNSGIDWNKVNQGIASGLNHPVCVHNGSFHDSVHQFYLVKRKHGKIANVKGWLIVAYDKAIKADCANFAVGRSNYSY